MNRAKEIALAHHMQVRDFCKALDQGQAYAAGAPAAPTASVRAGGSASLANVITTLGVKYGLIPIPADMLALSTQALPAVQRAAIQSHGFAVSRLANITMLQQQPQTPAVNAAVQKLINDIQSFIAQVQNDPSNQQLIQSGLHFIADIANVYVTASSADQSTLDALKGRLINLGVQVGAAAVTQGLQQLASSPSDGSDPGY